MGNKSKIKWLLKELLLLKSKKIINGETLNKIENYYRQQLNDKNVIKTVIITLSILSGLLITGGIILVVVNFNWFILTKEFKTFTAFSLLIVPQILCGYYLLRNNISTTKKEVFSTILSILFGVSIAFIGQIYQLPSNLEIFLLIWSISTLIIIYIFNSISSTALYLFLVIYLSSIMQLNGKIGLIFYPLAALLVPFYIIEYRRNHTLRIKTLDYFFALSFIIGLGISLEKTIPGLWLVAYSNLFVIYYLFGIIFEKQGNSLFYSPFKVSGVVGIGILSYMLTFIWPWEEIGWNYYRNGTNFHEIAAIFDYLICIIFPLIIVFLSYLSYKRKKLNNYFISIAGFLLLLLYIIASSGNSEIFTEIIPTVIMNAYILLLGGFSFYYGYRSKSLLTVNSAMFLVFLTTITRFFDQDMGALARGFAFMAIGVIILIVNLLIAKKLKKGNS